MLTYLKYTSFEEAENNWKTLWEKLPVKYPFLSWEWQKTWNEVFPLEIFFIYEVKENDKIIGICPLRLDGKAVKWLSGEEVSDYLDIITDEQNKRKTWELIIGDLLKNGIEKIELRNIPQDSKTLISLEEISQKNGLDFIKQKEDVVPFTELPKSFEEYLLLLTRKNRHELRRKVRRFEKEASNWQILKTNKDDIKKDCQTFFTLFTKEDGEKAKFLTPKMEEFFCKVSREMANLQLLDFTKLIIDNKIVAQTLAFSDSESLYLYNQASDPDYSHLSPGLILNKFLIEESILKCRKIYDFMQGHERYKYQLGAKDEYVYKIIINK